MDSFRRCVLALCFTAPLIAETSTCTIAQTQFTGVGGGDPTWRGSSNSL